MAKSKKKSSIPVKLGGIVAFIVTFVIVGAVLRHFGMGSNSSTNQPSNYLTTNNSTRVYTSTQDGFSINFPGNPTATDSTVQVQGVSVPTTTYERDNNNGNTDFIVSVDKYPASFDESDVNARLEGALNGEIQNVKGATLVSSNFGTLAGYTSITGHARVSESGQTYDLFSTDLLKGNTLYQIITVGASETDFNSFTTSFQFTQ